MNDAFLTSSSADKAYYVPTWVSLRAKAKPGYRFDHWEGALTGAANPQELYMNANRTVYAVFATKGPPVADAGAPQTVNERALVTLDGSGSYDPDGDTLTYSWEQTAGAAVDLSLQDPVHPTFTAPGVGAPGETLEFRLTVEDPYDGWDEASVAVTVQNVVDAPQANFTLAPAAGTVPLTVCFTDQSSGPPTFWAWDLDGDGLTDATAQDPCFTYAQTGVFDVGLTVANVEGEDSFTLVGAVDAQPSPQTDPVRIPGPPAVYFETIGAAYDAAWEGDVIQCQSRHFPEWLEVNRDGQVRIEGGFDGDFQYRLGRTSVEGIRVQGGPVVLDQIVVQTLP